MKIENINLKIIPDSRNQDTLEAEIQTETGVFKDSVPSGKSKGSAEAFVLNPGKALEKFNEIKSEILSKDFEIQKEFDDFLIGLDGTDNKSNLGGNLILVLSLAFARFKARSGNLELFEYLTSIAQLPITNYQLPYPIFNVINGGAHAKNNLEFQEFQIIPQVNDFKIAYDFGKEFYEKLKEVLEEKFGIENISLGDEAGFSAPFKNNEEALNILAELILKNNFPLRIGLDVAANGFFKENAYVIGEKKLSEDELANYYKELIKKFNIISIEDPFNENDFNSFVKLTADLNKSNELIITDDLTATNPKRLKKAIEEKSGNTILIKPNQIGSVTETLEVIKMAYENNWQTVVSHRSGETMDDFISDLAAAVGAWGIKAGAPGKPERIAKYDRLLKIQSTISF
ncbi:MAG: phosphopyruvate hydratase [Patescibacteria group bacterium]|nr:phosphopyruvate hydratase [Patescibacteria group bacterium]